MGNRQEAVGSRQEAAGPAAPRPEASGLGIGATEDKQQAAGMTQPKAADGTDGMKRPGRAAGFWCRTLEIRFILNFHPYWRETELTTQGRNRKPWGFTMGRIRLFN